MRNKMKVALISSVPIFPINSGNRSRIFQMVNALKDLGHDIVFIYLPVRNYDIDDDAHILVFGKENYIKISNGGFIRNFIQYFRANLVSKVKNLIQFMGVKAFYYTPLDFIYNSYWTHQLARLAKGIDVVMVEYVFNSRAFEAFDENTLCILDTHDAFADRHKLYINQGLKIGYWLSFNKADENKGFRRADIVVAIQEEEEKHFKHQLSFDRNIQNPTIVSISHLLKVDEPIQDYSAGNSAIFLGSDNPSNRKSIIFFIDKVLPLIVCKVPLFNLKLIGTICDYIGDLPNVTKLGRINDLKAAFCTAPLSLNPMLVGTGINIKLLDAMAMGVPTISTYTGVRGLPKIYQRGVVVVEDSDPYAFATEVIRFIQDEGLRKKIGEAAFYDARMWNKEQMNKLSKCLLKNNHSY